MKFCLSIDGGGIRGMMPAMVLSELEKLAGKKSHEMFDLIGGTSTGGIIATGLGNGNSAVDLVGLYEKEGPNIFKSSFGSRVKSIWRLNGPKYKSKGLIDALQSHFGHSLLSHSLTNIMVTSYNMGSGDIEFFKSYKAKEDPNRNIPMWVIAAATASAPTYFPPLWWRDYSGKDMYLIDGGVFSNNPVMCVWIEAKKLWPNEDIFILSLGNSPGKEGDKNAHTASKWGLISWAKKLPTIFMDSDSDESLYHIDKLNGERFIRLSPEIDGAMDDASEEHILRMRRYFNEKYREKITPTLQFIINEMEK